MTFPIDERWLQFGPEELESLAKSWIDELRGIRTDAEFGMSVTWMGFTAPADMQWQFILAAIGFAGSDEDLGHIAAGPIEYLLGRHGAAFIEDIEEQARSDPKFARTMTGVWKYLMTDDVWERVLAIQKQVAVPLAS